MWYVRELRTHYMDDHLQSRWDGGQGEYKQFCAQQIDDDPQATWDGIGWIHESDDCEKTGSMVIHLLGRKYQHNTVCVRRL